MNWDFHTSFDLYRFCKPFFLHPSSASGLKSQSGTLRRDTRGNAWGRVDQVGHGPNSISSNVQNAVKLGQGSATGSARGLLRGPAAVATTGGIPEEKHKSVANHSISLLLLTYVVGESLSALSYCHGLEMPMFKAYLFS